MRVQEFKTELKSLLKKYDAELGVNIDGDTHNLNYNFEVTIDKSNFANRPHIIADGYKSIDYSDIKL